MRRRKTLVLAGVALFALLVAGSVLVVVLLTRGAPTVACALGNACEKLSAKGGTVLVDTPVGRMRIDVPRGALKDDVALSVDVATEPLSFTGSGLEDKPGRLAHVAMPLKLEPSGQTFQEPILVRLPFDASLVPPGFDPKDLKVVVASDAGGKRAWETLTPSSVDVDEAVIVVAMKHFSVVAPVADRAIILARRAEADARYRSFYGLDVPTFTPAQQQARMNARCAELEGVLASYPGVTLTSTKVPREGFTRVTLLVPIWEGGMSTLLRSYTPPMDLKNSPYSDATLRHGPQGMDGKSYEAIFLDGIRASNHPLRLAEVLKLALDATGGDYPLAVLTAHNALKNTAYIGRAWQQHVPPEQALIAQKLESLRSGPLVADKMGPWYHAFGVLMVGGLLSSAEATALTSIEHGTRYVPFVSSSSLDPDKAAVDNCALRAARTIASLPPAPAVTSGPVVASATAVDAAPPSLRDAGRARDAASDAQDDAGMEEPDATAAVVSAIADAATDAEAGLDDWPGVYRGSVKGRLEGERPMDFNFMLEVAVSGQGTRLTMMMTAAGGKPTTVVMDVDPGNGKLAKGKQDVHSGTRRWDRPATRTTRRC